MSCKMTADTTEQTKEKEIYETKSYKILGLYLLVIVDVLTEAEDILINESGVAQSVRIVTINI